MIIFADFFPYTDTTLKQSLILRIPNQFYILLIFVIANHVLTIFLLISDLQRTHFIKRLENYYPISGKVKLKNTETNYNLYSKTFEKIVWVYLCLFVFYTFNKIILKSNRLKNFCSNLVYTLNLINILTVCL